MKTANTHVTRNVTIKLSLNVSANQLPKQTLTKRDLIIKYHIGSRPFQMWGRIGAVTAATYCPLVGSNVESALVSHIYAINVLLY